MSRKRKWKYDWPEITVDMPDTVIPQWLNYTIELLTPRKGIYEHPDDVERNKELVRACKIILKYVSR